MEAANGGQYYLFAKEETDRWLLSLMTIMHELSDYELAGRWANLMDIENGAMTDEGELLFEDSTFNYKLLTLLHGADRLVGVYRELFEDVRRAADDPWKIVHPGMNQLYRSPIKRFLRTRELVFGGQLQ